MDVVSSGEHCANNVVGRRCEAPVIRVPLLVRSNSGFKISAVFESKTAELTQLSVTDVRATGSVGFAAGCQCRLIDKRRSVDPECFSTLARFKWTTRFTRRHSRLSKQRIANNATHSFEAAASPRFGWSI